MDIENSGSLQMLVFFKWMSHEMIHPAGDRSHCGLRGHVATPAANIVFVLTGAIDA